ncbi:hypothetical protein [Paraburkholderia sp. J11-2]|uniref:hypothetical protein n=1 Tax=Paraburkholderia sp. J11-2 TaxID=2805431 RepID=UPI002AB7EEB1|nr:hypothetical protein [Paraburkholderia sp. J11-2]
MPDAVRRSPSVAAESSEAACQSHLRLKVKICFSTGAGDLCELCRDVTKNANGNEWLLRDAFRIDSKQMSIAVGRFASGSIDQKLKLRAARVSSKN